MAELFFEVFTQPLANLLVLLGNLTGGELGLGIILLTLVVRVLLFPFSLRIAQHQQKLRELEPEMERIRKQFTGNRVKQGEELSRLFQTRGISPLRPLLLALVQFPILIALWQLFVSSLDLATLDKLRYTSVSLSADTSFEFFGLFSLQERNLPLVVVAGGLQWLSLLFSPTAYTPTTRSASRMVSMFFPVLGALALSTLPSALALYWASSSLFGMLENRFILWRMHSRQKMSWPHFSKNSGSKPSTSMKS